MIVLDYTQSSGDNKKVGKLGYYDLAKDVGYLDANNAKRGNQPTFNHYLNKVIRRKVQRIKAGLLRLFALKAIIFTPFHMISGIIMTVLT